MTNLVIYLKINTSIIRIKSNLDNVSDKYDFKKVHEKEVKREIMNLNSKKATCHGAIPAKILKQFCDSYLPIITKIINESITEGTFPSELKLAEVAPFFKKLDCMNKENYRPISLTCTRCLKESFTINLMILWKIIL